METLLYYCIKVIVCSGILYGYYLLALRNNRFHHWNRWYLLAAVGLSFILPLLHIPLPDFSEKKTAVAYTMQLLATPDFYFAARKPETVHFTWMTAIALAYLLVTILLLFVLFKNLRFIKKLKYRYKNETANGIHFYNTTEPGTPFSFFKNIFWNSSIDLHTAKGRQMLQHEMAHITEWHSADKLLLQVLLVFAFWNPFLYLIQKELSVVHEFIADQKASAGDDHLQYASLLLMKAMGSQQFTLGNPFFHSQLKRRLIMLTTHKNPRFSYLRRLLVLPLAAISLILFSFKYKELKEKKQQESIPYSIATNEEKTFDDYQDTTNKKKMVILSNEKYKGSAIKSIVPTDDKKGIIVNTVDGNTYFLDRKEAATALRIAITDTGVSTPPGASIMSYDGNGVPSDVYSLNTVVTGKLFIPSQGVSIQDSGNGNIVFKGNTDATKQSLFVVDGQELTLAQVNAIKAPTIQSIDVLKDNSALEKYGERGRNGVVSITTKMTSTKDALIIIDGLPATEQAMNQLAPQRINSLSVLKGDAATAKYGEKGSKGVIDITTKLATNEVTFPEDDTKEKVVIGHRMPTNTTTQSKLNQEIVVQGYPTPKENIINRKLDDVTVVGYDTKQKYYQVFTKVEEPASFPGALEGWRRYLERNLQYPDSAQRNNTQGTVQVQLVVDETGNITEIKALNDPGNGLAEEAVRVLKKGPKWIPAKQNGKTVTYRFVQNITFRLQ